ncbi:MAG: uncharacterized membrane protein (UPF0127 family) [Zhongshania aliphaticivorans]|jgi:uncharacterized membrane protein (UPF0127 family)
MQALYPLISVLLLCACTPEKAPVKPVASDIYFSIPIDGNTPKLQLALTESERNRGLMYRGTLVENHGMLFLFEKPGRRSFWMRNTQIPLDLAYFDAQGELLEIHSLFPYDENTVYSYSEEVLIAVEMNQGWFLRKNIQPGAQLDMEALKQAIDSRGHSISNYSLEIMQ